jgi:hypothetical protein
MIYQYLAITGIIAVNIGDKAGRHLTRKYLPQGSSELG